MFDPVIPLLLLFITALPVVVLGVFLELKRKNTRLRKSLRILAYVGLCVGIIALVLQPKVKKFQLGNTVAYLTQGYSQRSLDSLKILIPSLKIYRKYDVESNHTKVASINHIYKLEKGIDSIYVLGYGLDETEREKEMPIKFLPSWPSGIIGIGFPKDITLGNSALVILHTQFEESKTVSITSPDGLVDSLKIEEGIKTTSFNIAPKLAGEFLYKSSYKTSDKEVEESIAIRVHDKPHFRVLILNDFPNFETRYLKNWLGTNGHKITVRNKISLAKYRYEYINTSQIPFGAFGSNYDLIILDESSLNALSRTLMYDLELAVSKGAGLMLQANNKMIENRHIKKWFEVKTTSNKEFKFKSFSLPRLSYQLVASRFHIPLITDAADGDVVVQKRIEDEGAILISFITQTYSLLLQGNKEIYDAYWSNIISSIVTKKSGLTNWKIRELLPKVNHPITIELNSNISNPTAMIDKTIFPLNRDISFKDEWEGYHWPTSMGWTKFSVLQDSVNEHWEYIYEIDAWQSVANQHKVKETLSFARIAKYNSRIEAVWVMISMWVWYGLILACLTFLWIEPKL